MGDRQGKLLAHRRRPTRPSGDPEQDLEAIIADAAALLEEAGVAWTEIEAVGVSAPGALDLERGVVVAPPNLPGWREVPLRERLARAFGRPVHLENDATAAALAEWRFGAGRGFDDLVYLTMSTGIGGGLVLGGRPYRGAGGNAGEVGHVCVEPDGAACACGRRGCLEAYAGGAAWTRRLRESAPEESRAVALANGRAQLTPEHVVAAAREGDAYALAELDRFNHYLARAISMLVFVLAPQIVVLGTIAAAAGEELCLAPLRERVADQVWPILAHAVRIEATALGSEQAELAGLCVALQALEASPSS